MSSERRRSQALYEKARGLMPGGVSSPVRAFRSVGGSPVYYRQAGGARFTDVDGNDYVDFCMSWGPLILGHAHPVVVNAVQQAAERGLSFGACCEAEPRLAELILEGFGRYDRVRFVNSGTEAVMSALRLARGATGRPRVLKFEGGYHGHGDALLVEAGSGLATFGTSSSAGVTAATAAETVVCPLDDEEALDAAFQRFGGELAAVIVEPLPANNGLLVQRPEWLQRLRRLCDQHGTLLIFDEVISGFRLGYGGYGDAIGVAADLVTLGKVIGGGMPIGALVGPQALMEQLAPLGPVYQAGTLSGNPVSLAAGIATLEQLRDGEVYGRLEALGRTLDEALAAAQQRQPVIHWQRRGSIAWFHLADGPLPRAAAAISPTSAERFGPAHGRLLDRGLYLAPSAFEMVFLSAAHTDADVEALAEGLAEALAEG